LLGGSGGSELDLGPISIPERRITSKDLDPEVLLPGPAEQRRSAGVSLVGREIANDDLQPGQPIQVALYWQAEQAGPQPGPLTVRAVDADGHLAGTFTGAISSGYPTGKWQAGSLLRDLVTIDLSPGASSGTYRLEAAWNGITPVVLGEVDIAGRNRTFAVPQKGTEVGASAGDFGKLARWIGTEDGAAKTATITLYWQDTAPTERSWTVFVHVLDDNGRIVAQSDHVPAGGAAPTQSWALGEVVEDVHQISLPAAGRYRIRVGMYDQKTNERMQFGAQDFVDLGQIG
jgi:hypothetical protein